MLKAIRELSKEVKLQLENNVDQLKTLVQKKHHDKLVKVVGLMNELDEKLVNYDPESDPKSINAEDIGLIITKNPSDEPSLVKIGGGHFGNVYEAKLKGIPVAVKIMKVDPKQKFLESDSLRSLRHDNIVAYRGMGMWNDKQFIVMEYVKDNLKTYIASQTSHDGKGLTARNTWNICQQIAHGMNYVHSQGIFHQDLKPDNILIDTRRIDPMVKLCDFGLACHSYTEKRVRHIRYYEDKKAEDNEEQSKLDVYAFGLVVLTCRTGNQPFDDVSSSKLSESQHKLEIVHTEKGNVWKIGDVLISDEVVGGKICEIIEKCLNTSLRDRPSFEKLIETDFKDPNPFTISEAKGELFECGFLKNTDIYVADSFQNENEHLNKEKPSYDKKDLICDVSIKVPNAQKSNYLIMGNQELMEKYAENVKKFKKDAKDGIIDNNKTIALKEIITLRDGDDEAQGIVLRFVESNYVHHRSVRDIWRGFDEEQKDKIVPCKQDVHPVYSTSFGLHVAILTKEKDGKKKFIFTQRSNKKGMANPGAYTCGAVESCSIKDYVEISEDKKTAKVSLIETARRGLYEELGLPLSKKDSLRIHLNTTYLKVDNHEWGMCGFVDLSDDGISLENQFSFEQLNMAFTSGPKDRFEHNCIEGVDFELPNMVEWIRKHHGQMASSAKIASVKVLYAFFGVASVTEAFSKFG